MSILRTRDAVSCRATDFSLRHDFETEFGSYPSLTAHCVWGKAAGAGRSKHTPRIFIHSVVLRHKVSFIRAFYFLMEETASRHGG